VTPDEVQAAIDRAISGVLADESHMVNRWLAVVETVDPEGDRGIWTFTSDGMMRWDTLGLLDYARMLEETDQHNGE
jgi:hypothetical protein